MKATLYEQPRQAIADCHIDMVYDYILLVTKAFGEIVTGKEVKRLHFNAPIVACVCAQFNGRLEVLMDEIVTGARVRANIFFDTFMKLGNKHLGITEAKRGDIRQGLERAYIGCEVIADAEGLSKVYSIVTDYRVWYFFKSLDTMIARDHATMHFAHDIPTRDSVQKSQKSSTPCS